MFTGRPDISPDQGLWCNFEHINFAAHYFSIFMIMIDNYFVLFAKEGWG